MGPIGEWLWRSQAARCCLLLPSLSAQWSAIHAEHWATWIALDAGASEEQGKGVAGTSGDRQAPEGATTDFGSVADRYLSQGRWRSIGEMERHLRRDAEPLHRRGLGEINRLAIADLLGGIERRSGAATRNKVRTTLSGFFNWAIAEGLAEINPVTGTYKADETPRDRVLSDAELSLIWRSLRDDNYGDIVRLLVLTGQRRKEIGSLRWSEIDFDRALIVLPAERVKNGRPHSVPLSPEALRILEGRCAKHRSNTRTDFLFGKAGFTGWSECKDRLDEALGATVKPWRLHDIRRTVATGMAELGVLPHIVEACLNHISGHKAGVAGTYNRARYEDEMRAALDRWAAHVARLVEIEVGSKLLPLTATSVSI